VGTLIKLDIRPEAFQFQSRAVYYWIILFLVFLSLLIVERLEQTRFGAWLTAVRENEDSARALGVDVFVVKIGATILSAAVTAAAGCFYAQYFLFIDSSIAFGSRVSVEALLAPIVGGSGTVFGALAGALAVRSLGEVAKIVAGDAPGIDLAIYGAVLIAVVAFAPRGIVGLGAAVWARLRPREQVSLVGSGSRG
jgi:branched-chain amino acid transport system permease protein